MSTYLILGATGKTARRLIPHLTEAGHTVRAAARTPGAAAPGVEPVAFDWADPTTHDAALAGADGVYVVPPALRLDYAPAVTALLDRARAAGVARAVLLSARGGEQHPGALQDAEAALRASGLAWSVIRPTWFAQNVTEGFFRPGLDGASQLIAPAGDGAEPFIDVEDIAAVAAAALTDARHDGQAYDLSGPSALTFAEVATILGDHAGRPIEYVDADPGAWEEATIQAGVPAPYASLLRGLLGLISAGQDAHLSDGVQRALGREPGSFEDWAAREAGVLGRTQAAAF